MAYRVAALARTILTAAKRVAGRHLVVAAMLVAAQCTAFTAARAEDEHLGITEYEIACMPCHGLEGRGDGDVAHALQVPPADLTQIAKANNGVFPARKVAEMVDGRMAVAGHMKREMPVWGDRYRKLTEPGESRALIDQRARAQINALVEFLESIQER